ncbi:M15 family metallopeptidase [Shewanella gaetbuli]|uniref:M15 family metallopeptidase n=1 Tax=Shewanella gaetbuli TaxID=220752 RepID=A0A9X2CLJ6_9GAMM|nr:M15 family metallopeptidase [Shewanella gaetbuli]
MLVAKPKLTQPHLYGCDASALVPYQTTLLHPDALIAYEQMKHSIQADGLDIDICSGYRSFDKQLAIWNAKASGQRVLLDKHSKPVDIKTLNQTEIVDTILIWSALPGTSRHHWGTDIDVFDPRKISRDNLQLVSAEYQHSGPCHELYSWLKSNAFKFGFYFPFQQGKSGVSPEEWHLSYFPVAQQYTEDFCSDTLLTLLTPIEIHLKQDVLPRLNALVQHYVKYVARPNQ